MYHYYITSPIGHIQVSGDAEGIQSLTIVDSLPATLPPTHPALIGCIRQLQEYFDGKRDRFTVKLNPQGTEFQKQVWQALMHIPFGATVSYQDVAEYIGKPKAFRAVGNANNKNPLPLVIPCHRVLGKSGSLVGYAYGLQTKSWLLDHEYRISKKNSTKKSFTYTQNTIIPSSSVGAQSELFFN